MDVDNATACSVMYDGTGGAGSITFVRHALPVYREHELLIKVHASALNRADLLQRDGQYQVAPGELAVPGVEVAGHVLACGSAVSGFAPGDRIYAVVPGGGYATHCVVDQGMAMPVPGHWSYTDAAAVAEAGLTADTALFTVGGLQPGQKVLIHAAASGIGSMVVQMVREAGARAICTTNSPDKVEPLYALGAEQVLCGYGPDFYQGLCESGHGAVDLVIDFIGGRYFDGNLSALKPGGTLVMVGLLDAFEWQANFVPIINKRLSLHGVVLRKRPDAEKRQVTQAFLARWQPALASGRLTPVVSSIHPFAAVAQAQEEMAANRNIGKVVLSISQ